MKTSVKYGYDILSKVRLSQRELAPDIENATIAYRNLIDTCRTMETRNMYAKALNYFMSYLRLPLERYDKLLDLDYKMIQKNVIDYISYLRKQRSHNTVSTYVAALRKFYSMNDIQLNWDKIHSYQGGIDKQAEDRPYTHSEIATMLAHTSIRNKAIILVMCSGGLRVGAIETIRIKDLEPLDKHNIYKINVYAISRKSKYFTFCTPECRKEIDNYLDYRKRWGERLSEDTPLFRKEHNKENDRKVLPLQTGAIRWLIASLLKDTGLRPVMSVEDRRNSRSNIMQCHGLRKFFESNSFKAGMNNMYLRRLMGQKSGLEDSYLKLSEEDLLEGDSKHVGYIDVIDQLTINEENRLKKQVKELKHKETDYTVLESKIVELQRVLGLSTKKVEELEVYKESQKGIDQKLSKIANELGLK